MSSWDFRTWLLAEKIKALEKDGKAGFVQHARLVKEYLELTGEDWDEEK